MTVTSAGTRLGPASVGVPTLAIAPAAAVPLAYPAVQIVGAGLLAAGSALLLQRDPGAARRALAEMAGRLGAALGWSREQIEAAADYLQRDVLEQLRRSGVAAGAIARIAGRVWEDLQGIVARQSAPGQAPQQTGLTPLGSSTGEGSTGPQRGPPPRRPPTEGSPMLPPAAAAGGRSNAGVTPGLQAEVNALESRVAALRTQAGALDQTRVLSVADIANADAQRNAFMGRVDGLRREIRTLEQRAVTAMASGLSASDYLGLSGRLQRAEATLAGLERAYDTAMTNALQRAVRAVEAAIANGQALPYGRDFDAYGQMANQLQWFGRQAGLEVFSAGSRQGFESRVRAALRPASVSPPGGAAAGEGRPRPSGPTSGAPAGESELASLRETARKVEQARQAAQRELRLLLAGPDYTRHAQEIIDRQAQRFGIAPETLRDALNAPPAAPGPGGTPTTSGSAGGGQLGDSAARRVALFAQFPSAKASYEEGRLTREDIHAITQLNEAWWSATVSFICPNQLGFRTHEFFELQPGESIKLFVALARNYPNVSSGEQTRIATEIGKLFLQELRASQGNGSDSRPDLEALVRAYDSGRR